MPGLHPGCFQGRWQILTKSQITQISEFPPKGSLGKVSADVQTMLQRLQQPFPQEALSKHLLVHVVPVRRSGNQHPRNWLGTAISRQIWQFRPRKHKRFLPTGTHPTPMKEITTLLATLEEGLHFSPSVAVCCLACYLQLKSFCFKLLCLAMEGGI